MDIFNRVNYLQAIAQELSKEEDIEKLRLASFYGYTCKEICLKNQVATFGWDPIKRQSCKLCYSSLIVNSDGYDPVRLSIVKSFLVIECKQCGYRRKIKISKRRKNYYERLVYGDGGDGHQSTTNCPSSSSTSSAPPSTEIPTPSTSTSQKKS